MCCLKPYKLAGGCSFGRGYMALNNDNKQRIPKHFEAKVQKANKDLNKALEKHKEDHKDLI